MNYKKACYSGTQSMTVSEREKKNRETARKIAEEGIVLIKNDGVLPLDIDADVALYGSGALFTVKGGTGSGDVNERETVSIYEGMKNAGFQIENERWLDLYHKEYTAARNIWKEDILRAAAAAGGKDSHTAFVNAYVQNKFLPPAGPEISEAERSVAQCAIYVLSRQAGEGKDRHAEKGDYYLSDEEEKQLRTLRQLYQNLVLVLNTGGPVDLNFTKEIPVNAIIYISQPGMEGGNAFASVISGKITPSGKMTDTWAEFYEDYPNAKTFSHCNGNVEQELYEEGIYVGYRYFDTFGVKPVVPFGFGMSYTDFSITFEDSLVTSLEDGSVQIEIQALVTNTGEHFSGKDVVQVYVSCPQTEIRKEFQRLCAFAKTPELKPGESCQLQLKFPLIQLASFYEQKSAFVLEAGEYTISIGNSSDAAVPCCIFRLHETLELRKTEHICPLQQDIKEIKPEKVPAHQSDGLPVLEIDERRIPAEKIVYRMSEEYCDSPDVCKFVDSLEKEQLLALTNGDPAKGHGASDTFGSSGLSVPGAAGETSSCAKNAPWNLADIVLADGPAGLRLAPEYYVDADGAIIKPTFKDSIERGFFAEKKELPGAKRYYQFCTGFPVGTMCAQTWNVALMHEMGLAVGEEMTEFGITLWLAPGMNIHRNPLCGRNFEYYSEDPYLTGIIAAALIKGVQENPGIGVTIKHLACNNQEDNRKHSDSVVSERALREIYLHGFEIAVKEAQPMAVMPSYNLINGIHAANSYDLITKVVRQEWGFKGVVVSDWTTTGSGGALPEECMKAGTDLIMPGSYADINLIKEALDSKTLDIKDVKRCVSHLVNIIWQSLEYEGCRPYSEQFSKKR